MKMAPSAMPGNLEIQTSIAPSTVPSSSLAVASPYPSSASSTQTHFQQFWDDRLEAPKYIVGPSRSTASPKASTCSTGSVKSKRSRTSKQPAAEPKDKSGELFFFNMSDPSQPIPKSDLRPIRQHVMKRWLEKNQGDSRTKRKRNDSGYATNKPKITKVPTRIKTPPSSKKDYVNTAQSVCTDASYAKAISDGSTDESDESESVENEIYAYMWQGFPDVMYRPVADDGRQMIYLATPIFTTFLHNDGISGKINPFKEWPKFPKPDVEVERLKWLCSRRFGSEALAHRWVPTLMKTKHAFYSTICISAAHDDVMNAELGIENPVHAKRRTAIRECILQMITESMRGGHITDGTIIAVLHVLYGELISGDPELIRTNHNGLDIMITTRGGASGLGMHGSLAKIVVITMHLIGVLLEETPKADYTSHAKGIVTEPPPNDRYIPESPIYTVTGFAVPPHMQKRSDAVQHILEYASQATSIFGARYKIQPQSLLSQDSNETMADHMLRTMHDRIFSFEKVESMTLDARAGTMEAVRLAAQTFVKALLLKIPISQAARLLEQEQAQISQSTLPIHVQIKDAVKQTTIDDCWGPRSGILLWIGLVALASANDRKDIEDEGGAEAAATAETARRWITAIVIRCSILQSFEYTHALLGMLKRFVAIQQVLDEGRASSRPEAQISSLTLLQNAMSKKRKYGPSPPPQMHQTTMKDCAWQPDIAQQGYT